MWELGSYQQQNQYLAGFSRRATIRKFGFNVAGKIVVVAQLRTNDKKIVGTCSQACHCNRIFRFGKLTFVKTWIKNPRREFICQIKWRFETLRIDTFFRVFYKPTTIDINHLLIFTTGFLVFNLRCLIPWISLTYILQRCYICNYVVLMQLHVHCTTTTWLLRTYWSDSW